MKKYKIVERNSHNNRTTILKNGIESYKDAKNALEEMFLGALVETHTPEVFEDYFMIKLGNGKIINYKEFTELKKVDNFGVIFTGGDRWEENGCCYFIEEEKGNTMKRDKILMKNFQAPSYQRATLIISILKEKYPIIKHKINRKLTDIGTEQFSTIVEIAIAEQELSVADEYASKIIKRYLPRE